MTGTFMSMTLLIFPKWGPLLLLIQDVTPHLFGGTVPDIPLTFLNFILQKTVPSLDVLGVR